MVGGSTRYLLERTRACESVDAVVKTFSCHELKENKRVFHPFLSPDLAANSSA